MIRTELAADVWSRVTLNKERGGCPTGATKAVRRCERAGISRQERQYMLRQKVRTDRVEESALRVAGHGCQQQRRVIEDVCASMETHSRVAEPSPPTPVRRIWRLEVIAETALACDGCSHRRTRCPSRASFAATANAVLPPPRTPTASPIIVLPPMWSGSPTPGAPATVSFVCVFRAVWHTLQL